VTLALYDVSGREVARLADARRLGSGMHRIPFDGRGLRSGVYVCLLKAGPLVEARRMALIR